MNEKKFANRGVYKVMIDAPIETVWSELVKQKAPRPFIWGGEWDAPEFAAGNPYRVLVNNGNAVAVIGRILEMDPPRRLVTTFRLTNHPDPASKVIYTLAERNGKTEFSLITENVPAGTKSEKSMADGAKFIVENFKAYMETGKVTFGARMMLVMYSLMTPMMPKSMRAENWPYDKAE